MQQRPTIPDKDIPGADPDQLVFCFFPWVKKIALRYHALLDRTGAVDLDDLCQVGSLALLKAKEKYDPEAGASFLHFSQYYIRNAIRRELGFSSDGESPVLLDYLDEPIGEDQDISKIDMVPDDTLEPALDKVIREESTAEIQTEVRNAVDELKNDKQREIINRVYFKQQTRSQAAEEMGVSYGVGNAIEHQALQKLHRNSKLQDLVEYRRFGFAKFRNLWRSEEEDFILRQEKAFDEIHGAGAYVRSFQNAKQSRIGGTL